MVLLGIIRKITTCFLTILTSILFYTSVVCAMPDINSATEKIPDMIISLHTGEKTEYVIAVEKESQQLLLYAYDGTYKIVDRFKCTTGEVAGAKSISGDKKTPEGVYFFTDEYKKKDLAPIYGSRAFPMDYPNYADQARGLEGNAIWLHGTNKPIKPRDSNGCVALKNSDIDRLSKKIALNRTPIIMAEKLTFVAPDSTGAVKKSIMKFLDHWEETLNNGNPKDVKKLYDDSYREHMSWWKDWMVVKQRTKASYPSFSAGLDKKSIFKHNGVYIAMFDETVKSSYKNMTAGTRKLYLAYKNGKATVVGDEYLGKEKSDVGTMLIEAGLKLEEVLDNEYEISIFVEAWLKAWASRDIEKYGDCYANDFIFRKMDRTEWLTYKDNLNKKYSYIRVGQKNLVIKRNGEHGTATFEQNYESSGFRAHGIKQLTLKREGGKWKIFRETWRKL